MHIVRGLTLNKQYHRKRVRSKRRATRNLAVRRAKQLSRRATPAEKKLIHWLAQAGIFFEFQRPIWDKSHCRIADFYIPRGFMAGLVVELDGKQHDTPKIAYDDLRRTEWIKRTIGADVIRFKNEEVLENVNRVLAIIRLKLDPTAGQVNACF